MYGPIRTGNRLPPLPTAVPHIPPILSDYASICSYKSDTSNTLNVSSIRMFPPFSSHSSLLFCRQILDVNNDYQHCLPHLHQPSFEPSNPSPLSATTETPVTSPPRRSPPLSTHFS
ncbi:hypothetical protein L1887_29726 [Cichorium endivia]|nr:hypothetical protein L1887_29726 [Cichorium endivia]